MRRKLKNVRKIRVGLRLQISFVMIVSIALISIIFSVVIIKKNEQTVINEIAYFSGSILKGVGKNTRRYFYHDRHIRNQKLSGITEFKRNEHRKKRDEYIEKISEFFKDMIAGDPMLDAAFLIYVVETDNAKSSTKNRFFYFSKKSATVETDTKQDAELDQLRNFFLSNIATDIHFKFLQSADQNKQETTEDEIVVVGYPIFTGKNTRLLLEEYSALSTFKKSNSSLEKKDTTDQTTSLDEKHKQFENTFIKLLVKNYSSFDYLISPRSDKDWARLYYYFSSIRYQGKLTRDQKKIAREEFIEQLKSFDTTLSFQKYRDTCLHFAKKYNLRLKPDIQNWVGFYNYLSAKQIKISSPLPLEELALEAYRSDLHGILGIRLLGSEFFKNLKQNRREAVNIGLSIFLRLLFIALLFPTFIIRKVNHLADGAYEIGRGNFEYRFKISGSDEVGRLSDIFNIMGKNLKKAREEMVEKNRMAEELKTAEAIQQVLLPESLPQINGLDFAAHYSAQSEAGGDYYDFIAIDDNRLGITIADVSGHGVGSGLVMTITRTLLHSYSTSVDKPGELLKLLNDHLHKNTASNFFVSMFYAIYDIKKRSLSFASAGHHPALIVRKGAIKELPAGGIALGAVSSESFDRFVANKSTQLEKGDLFIQYTDGIVEAMNTNNDEYGEERFYDIVTKYGTKDPATLKEAIIKDLKKFTGSCKQNDDITMIIMRVL